MYQKRKGIAEFRGNCVQRYRHVEPAHADVYVSVSTCEYKGKPSRCRVAVEIGFLAGGSPRVWSPVGAPPPDTASGTADPSVNRLPARPADTVAGTLLSSCRSQMPLSAQPCMTCPWDRLKHKPPLTGSLFSSLRLLFCF